jgi:predicted nucleotidyltransferase
MGELVTIKEEVLNRLRQNGVYLQTLGVKRIGLFGSFARGEQQDAGDIDLLVEFEKEKKTFDNFMARSFYLETLFLRRVELITPESLSPYIGPNILKEVEYAQIAT